MKQRFAFRTFLASAILATGLMGVTAVPAGASSEPGGPFDCSSSIFFLSQGIPTALLTGTETTNVATFNQLGPTATVTYNALGYDPVGNYLYALSGGTNLLRIDNSGTVTSLGPITSLPTGTNYNVGAFDGSDDYWITKTGTSTAYEINYTAAIPYVITSATVHLRKPFGADDWSWTDGYFWGLSGTTIYRVDITTGAVSTFAAPSGLLATSNTTFGAAWTYGNTNLGFSNNQSGVIDEISVAHPASLHPSFGVVSSYTGGPIAGQNNDGAACVGQPTDLSIVKRGPASVTPGGTVTWQLTVTDNGPGNSSGFAVSDTVPAGYTAISAPGCVVTLNTVVCSEGALADGNSLVITITATAPTTAGTCLTNTATVTANELDSVTDNNSSSVTTCTSTPNGGTLKICKVAGFGVTVGTPFDFSYQTGNGSGVVSVPAGPAPGGYCVVVGTFKQGSYTVTEEPSAGNTVTAITAVPSGGTADLKKGSIKGKLLNQSVTEVTYTDQNIPAGQETGYLEICKQVQAQPGVALPSYFVFTVDEPGGLVQTLDVPTNACSPATEVVAGSETVTETPVSGYAMSGCSSIPAANLVSCNPNGNAATVTVEPGGVQAETILTVTNSPAAADGCGDSSGTEPTVTATAPTSPTISYGNSDTDTATVRGAGSNPNLDPTGTVCFYLCGPAQAPQSCTSQADPLGSPVAVTAGGAGEVATATSPVFTPPDSPVASWWCFGAYYSGDTTFSSSSDTSTDECFQAI